MWIEFAIIMAYAIAINWLISLHDIYQAAERRREKVLIIGASIIIAMGLGVVSLV
jgi:hypothetical protein